MFNALRRFINLKGLLKQIRNDCGKNFTRADEELGLHLCRWVYQQRINGFCTYRGIKWISNPPGTCHMGGAWERMTKAVHQMLKALLKGAVLSQGARNDRREDKCKLRQQFLNGQLWKTSANYDNSSSTANYETCSPSLSSSSSSLTSSSTSSSQYFQLLFSSSLLAHSKSWLFLLSPSYCFGQPTVSYRLLLDLRLSDRIAKMYHSTNVWYGGGRKGGTNTAITHMVAREYRNTASKFSQIPKPQLQMGKSWRCQY